MNWKTLNGLLLSRKFWLALIGFVGAAVLYFQGAITAEMFVDTIVAFVGILIGSIAVEDAAKRVGIALEFAAQRLSK